MSLLLLLCVAAAEAQTLDFDRARARIAALPDDSVKADQYLMMAAPYMQSGYRRFIDLLSEALRISEAVDFPAGQTRALTGMCLGHFHAGKFQDALSCGERALAIARRLAVRRYLGNALNAIGMALSGLGRREEALRTYEEALSVARSTGYLTLELSARSNLGSTLFKLDRNAEATAVFEAALRLADSTGNTALAAMLCNNLGNTQTTPEAKLRYCQRALAYHGTSGDRYNKAVTLLAIGETQRAMCQYKASLDALHQGYAIAAALDYDKLIGLVASALGSTYQDAHQDDQAVAWYQTALEHLQRTDDETSIGITLVNLARLYQCGRPSDAGLSIEYARRALDIATRTGDRTTMLHGYKLLAAIYECRRDFEQAHVYVRLYAAMRDSLFKETNAATINELSARYDADRREGELRELRDRNRIAELELGRRALETRAAEQRARLFAQQNAITALELERSAQLLERDRIEAEKRRKHLALLTTERALHASVADRAVWQRNSAIGAIVFLGTLLFVGYARTRERRRADALRAEAAEFKARAAEATALAAAAALEREQKEAQKVFSRSLIEAQEAERKRIAAELHDSLGQELLVIKNDLLAALQRDDLDAPLAAQLDALSAMTSAALGNVRQIARDLRPYQLDRFGLASSMRAMADRMAESTGIALTCQIDGADGAVAREHEIHVYRLLQECMANIARHAHATEALIWVRVADGMLRIRVQDNGRGFAPGAALAAAPGAGHGAAHADDGGGFGLRGMRERVDMLGGTLDVDAAPGRGTIIQIAIPTFNGERHG